MYSILKKKKDLVYTGAFDFLFVFFVFLIFMFCVEYHAFYYMAALNSDLPRGVVSAGATELVCGNLLFHYLLTIVV